VGLNIWGKLKQAGLRARILTNFVGPFLTSTLVEGVNKLLQEFKEDYKISSPLHLVQEALNKLLLKAEKAYTYLHMHTCIDVCICERTSIHVTDTRFFYSLAPASVPGRTLGCFLPDFLGRFLSFRHRGA